MADGNLLIFVGSGLSYGTARKGQRRYFDMDSSPVPDLWHNGDDDYQPMPTWPQLIDRMRSKLWVRAEESEQES
ncbi:hypothetical protein [Gordonia asplenii]|uniref:hypothetical protein n=1 Tax=Gordonia asplenii TaxID=2725283 RepID=UPI001B7D69C1|nr:hypothetical protein [Gordonia asplenii]